MHDTKLKKEDLKYINDWEMFSQTDKMRKALRTNTRGIYSFSDITRYLSVYFRHREEYEFMQSLCKSKEHDNQVILATLINKIRNEKL